MIRELSPETIARLAAGEIIHSFQQSLKELVENAVDAGAQRIKLQIGERYVCVSNDNSSISRDNHEKLCVRFCTSKLATFEDLESVATHGFRGEALAAMSYVGTVTCTSGGFRSRHEQASMQSFEAVDELDDVGDAWTTFRVDFDEMECEKNVLKTVEALVCIYYGVSFSIQADALTTHLEACESFDQAIERYFESSAEKLSVSGDKYVADVYFCFSVKPSLCIVNNRYLPQQQLISTVQRLAQGTEKSSRQLSVCLRARIDPVLLDVNCHPQKLRVIITNESEIVEALEQAFLAHIKAKAGVLLPITPVKPQKEVYQDSPLRALRITSNRQTLASQLAEQRSNSQKTESGVTERLKMRFFPGHSQFPAAQRKDYAILGQIEVIGTFKGQSVLIQHELQICQIDFCAVGALLRNLLAEFAESGLSPHNPLVKCSAVCDAPAAPMRNGMFINPIALLRSAAIEHLYDEKKHHFVPRIADMNAYAADLDAWLALFALKLFEHVKTDANLLFEVLRDCDAADARLVIAQSELLKMFNRL